MERIPPLKEDNNVDQKIKIDYILNSIKSQEDIVKQLMQINAILLGIYLGIATSDSNITAIRNYITMTKYDQHEYLAQYAYWVIFFILLIPIIFWLFSLIKSIDILKIKADIDAHEGLIHVFQEKHALFAKCYWCMVIGLTVACLIFVVSLYYTLDNSFIGGDAQLLITKGIKFHDLGEYDEAIKVYDEVIKINPTIQAAWNNKGNSLNKLKRYNESLRSFDVALAISSNAQTWNNKGITYLSIQNYDEALYCFNKSINLDPRFEDAWNSKGLAFLSLGKYPEAIRCFNESIRLNPNDAGHWNNKGLVFANMGKYNEAINCYNESLFLDPDNAGYWGNKGIALYYLAKYNESIEAFDIALDQNRRLAVAWNYRDLCLKAIGDHHEANNALNISKTDDGQKYWSLAI